MDIKEFLNTVCNQIKYKPVRESISDELKNHIEEVKEELVKEGIKTKDAEEKAINQMGSAEEIGKKLNKIHRPKLDWKLLLLIIILIGFGLIVAVLQQSAVNNNRIEKTIFYMMIGVGLSVVIYFLDYRKMKGYSKLIYILATVIMLLPFWDEVVVRVNGLRYVQIGSIFFNPSTVANPLYLIAFCGYITSYKKDNAIKIQIEEKEFKINKDFIKISVLCLFSLILIMNIPSFTNATILSLAYLVISTIRIIQDKETRVKKLIIIYGTLSIFAIFLMVQMVISPYRLDRFIVSFKPEIDPLGSGYTGMLQKEVLENARWIGEAETRVISSDEYIISLDSNYTFIYLLRKDRNSCFWTISFNNPFHIYQTNDKCQKYKRSIWKNVNDRSKYLIYYTVTC